MASESPTDTFDVIIIGGGTAGSVLAARLSAASATRILVLEAGENRNKDPNVSTPGLQRFLLGYPSYDWQFKTLPEPGLNDRVIKQPRGKLWGGSSAINSHALVYPSRRYHDAWSTLLERGTGEIEERWDWEGVGKYYRKFQSVQLPNEKVKQELGIGYLNSKSKSDASDGHRSEIEDEKDTSVQASFPAAPNVLQRAWTDAIRDLGYDSSKNPIDGTALGGSTTTTAIDGLEGVRSHAGVAYLGPSLKRANLVIRSKVLVEKIIFDEKRTDGKLVATGVVYSQEGGGNTTVYARREVIVAAGTYGSPKVLELSGIGQSDRLAAASIDCIQDVPGVGENLQDHLNFGPSVEVHDSIETRDNAVRDPAVAAADQKLYNAEHKGPLAEGATYSFSYMPLQALSSLPEEQKLELLVKKVLEDSSSTTSKGLKAQYEIIQRMICDPKEATSTVFMTRQQRYTQPSKPVDGNYMTIIAMLSYPFSRGTSHITSSTASDYPNIKFNYLSHPLDAEILARHAIHIGKFLELPVLSALLKPGGNTLPEKYPRHTTEVEDVKEFLRDFAATNYHPVGTCAMMREDLGGVVDKNLRVYGTTNVRVCDASIIPILPRGNILSTVYAIAEKGADILKKSLK